MIRLGWLRWAIILGVSIFSAPISAQQPMPRPAENYREMSLEKLVAFARSIDGQTDPCTRTVPILSELLERRPDLTQLDRMLTHARLACAQNRKSYQEAYEQLLLLEAAGGELSAAYTLYLAVMADDGVAANARLQVLLQSDDTEVRDMLTPELASMAVRAAWENGNGRELEDMLASEVRAGMMENFGLKLRRIFAINALGAVAREGDLVVARQLIDQINEPPTYSRLLADRQFAQLWPLLEERVGPGFRRITQDYKKHTLSELEAAPDNSEALSGVIHALYYAGEFADLIAKVDAATARPDLADTLIEDEGWMLNLKAYSLDALGRQAEADAVFDLIGLAHGEDHYWRVNFVINRASRLVGQGRWEEGLVAAQLAAEVAAEHGSPYARALTLRDRICALNALGRTDDAVSLVDDLRVEAEQYAGLLAEGLLCLGQEAEAAEAMIAALGDEQLRRSLVDELQDKAFDLFYTRSILPKPRDLLQRNEALREAYLQYARIIPAEFYPAASLMR